MVGSKSLVGENQVIGQQSNQRLRRATRSQSPVRRRGDPEGAHAKVVVGRTKSSADRAPQISPLFAPHLGASFEITKPKPKPKPPQSAERGVRKPKPILKKEGGELPSKPSKAKKVFRFYPIVKIIELEEKNVLTKFYDSYRKQMERVNSYEAYEKYEPIIDKVIDLLEKKQGTGKAADFMRTLESEIVEHEKDEEDRITSGKKLFEKLDKIFIQKILELEPHLTPKDKESLVEYTDKVSVHINDQNIFNTLSELMTGVTRPRRTDEQEDDVKDGGEEPTNTTSKESSFANATFYEGFEDRFRIKKKKPKGPFRRFLNFGRKPSKPPEG